MNTARAGAANTGQNRNENRGIRENYKPAAITATNRVQRRVPIYLRK
jgi:hypothetical protein